MIIIDIRPLVEADALVHRAAAAAAILSLHGATVAMGHASTAAISGTVRLRIRCLIT